MADTSTKTDYNNPKQIKTDINNFFNQNSLHRSKYKILLNRMMDALLTNADYTNIDSFTEGENAIEKIQTVAGIDGTTSMPTESMNIGTKIRVLINGINYEYILKEGSQATQVPFFIRPFDWEEANHEVYWKLNQKEVTFSKKILSADILSLPSTPVEILPLSDVKYNIKSAIFSMEFNKVAYVVGDGSNLILKVGTIEEYTILAEVLKKTENTYSFFGNKNKTISGEALQLSTDSADITTGESDITITLSLTIL